MKIALAVTVLGLSAAAAAAQPRPAPSAAAFDRCVRHAAGVTADLSDCQTREIKRQEARLYAAYGAAVRRASAPGRKALRVAERRWLAERRRTCTAAGQEDAGGSAQGLAEQSCVIDRTRTRASYLQTLR